MWYSYAKLNRLEKALEYRGLDPRSLDIQRLFNVLAKRGTDKQLNPLVGWLLGLLEPPVCHREHCLYHSSQAFCKCADGRIPGRCKEYREYLKRRKQREEKQPAPIPFRYQVGICEGCGKAIHSDEEYYVWGGMSKTCAACSPAERPAQKEAPPC